MKKIALSFFLLVPALFIGHLLYLYTHTEFAPHEFYRSLRNDCALSINPEETLQALNQPYSYAGCGKQMTVFESSDQRYVIKFFNPRVILKKKWFSSPKKLGSFCSLKWLSNAYFKREARIAKLFHRYAVGFEEFRSESGLVYAHLSPATSLSKTLCLTDKQGEKHLLNLKRTPFVLQKKAVLATKHFDQLMQTGQIEKMQEDCQQISQFFLERAQKGFTDRIQTLHNNYGFADGRFIQIDLGRIHKTTLNADQETERVLLQIKKFLKDRYPSLAPFLETALTLDK